jgi:hypothetical protein
MTTFSPTYPTPGTSTPVRVIAFSCRAAEMPDAAVAVGLADSGWA